MVATPRRVHSVSFLVMSLLLLVASVMVTVIWGTAMSAMGGMPMHGGPAQSLGMARAQSPNPAVPMYPQAPPKLKFNEAVRGMFDALVGDLIQTTALNASTANVKSVEDVRLWPSRLAGLSVPETVA